MDIVWDGITRAETLRESVADARYRLSDAAREYNWPRVFEILSEDTQLVNCCRPGDFSLCAPLHQAACGGASEEIVKRLIDSGAWRTLRNAQAERPIDVAERNEHRHLLTVLEPVTKHHVPMGILLKIQEHFHALIRGRVKELIHEHTLRLPELEPLLELERPKMWFAVPGMYGGFSYRLESTGDEAKLVSETWSRIVGGSGQRHEISSEGSRLVEEGFV